MKSAWNSGDCEELLRRVRALEPDAQARWGRMTAPQMVAHLVDAARMALGDLAVPSKRLPIRFTPIKQLIIYCLPFPKGAPTAPELIARSPASWQDEVADLANLLGRFARRESSGPWPDHPAFGRLSRSAWGVLVYRHTDHHLRQFGA